jgi:hypothetical protein
MFRKEPTDSILRVQFMKCNKKRAASLTLKMDAVGCSEVSKNFRSERTAVYCPYHTKQIRRVGWMRHFYGWSRWHCVLTTVFYRFGPEFSQFSFLMYDRVRLVRRPLFGLLYQLRMIDDECGAVGGMRIDRGKRSTRRKPVPVSLCPPQIPHVLMWARARAAAVGSWWLTAWAMARPVRA